MSRDYVALLHGLGRTHLSMAVPQLRFHSAGFQVLNVHYPSRSKPLSELARGVADELARRVTEPDRPVHFLTHSMGGIVLRTMLSEFPPEFELGRVVMLAPPNRGSRLAERLGDQFLFRAVTGPAGQELRADGNSRPEQLGPADFEVGVIAGSNATSPWSFLLPGDSDGTVRVDETALEGMADFLVVPRGHTFIMNDRQVIDQAIQFFRTGRFSREEG